VATMTRGMPLPRLPAAAGLCGVLLCMGFANLQIEMLAFLAWEV